MKQHEDIIYLTVFTLCSGQAFVTEIAVYKVQKFKRT